MDETKDYAVTIFGITALQMPTLISIAPKDSILFNLQALGSPFNMTRQFMKDHIAFSPGNVFAGRYYTLFTSVYYHTDLIGPLAGIEPVVYSIVAFFAATPDHHHLLQNMVVLAAAGKPVHKQVGRLHFLSIFTGGGFIGNLGMWLHCVIQKILFKPSDVPVQDLRPSPSSVGNIFVKICKDTCSGTMSISEILNTGITCYGSSAGVNAILSFGACCSAERIVRRLRECLADRSLELDIYFFSDVMNIVFTLRLFSNDVVGIMGSFLSENGFFDQLTKSGNIIGYAGHVAGTFFGIAYYYFMYIRS